MSRIIAAVVLAVTLVGICIADRAVVNRIYDTLYTGITACEQTELTDRTEAVLSITQSWRESEGLLSVFVNHSILDEIGESVARLEAMSDEEDEDFFAECAVIKLKLENIKKDSGINLHSVF